MSKSILSEARFHNEDAARKHLETMRWPDGAVCPHCGGADRNSALKGESHRSGLYFCGDCRQQFTVTVGTVFERSKIPLHKWVLATHLICASKKGMSSKQIERMLGVTYKTAWFMTHRIREAMKPGSGGLLGSSGQPVEVDETYWGNIKGRKVKQGAGKRVALVEWTYKKPRFKKRVPGAPDGSLHTYDLMRTGLEFAAFANRLENFLFRACGLQEPHPKSAEQADRPMTIHQLASQIRGVLLDPH